MAQQRSLGSPIGGADPADYSGARLTDGAAFLDPRDISDRTARVLGRTSRGQSVSPTGAGGRVVAPAAAAVIATTGALTNNVHEVWITAAVGVGGLAADDGNMELRQGATVVAVLAVGAGGPGIFGPFRLSISGGAAVTVNATGNATAGVVYSATIAATRIE